MAIAGLIQAAALNLGPLTARGNRPKLIRKVKQVLSLYAIGLWTLDTARQGV